MVIEDEVNDNRSNNNTNRNTKSLDNVDPSFMQDQIAKIFNIWSDISRLPTVGPSFAYSQYSRSDLKEFVEFGMEKAPKQYNSKQDFENYRKIAIDVFEDAFTGLFDSKEYAILYGLVLSNQYDLLTHLQKLTEKNFKVLNLPTRSEMDDLSKDIHDLKKTVHDLTRKMEALKINESGNIPT